MVIILTKTVVRIFIWLSHFIETHNRPNCDIIIRKSIKSRRRERVRIILVSTPKDHLVCSFYDALCFNKCFRLLNYSENTIINVYYI